MYLAGFALPAPILGRVFALAELVRSVADFLLAPVMQKIAQRVSHEATLSATGLRHALWLTVLLAGGTIAVFAACYLTGCGTLSTERSRPRRGGSATTFKRGAER